MTGSIIFKSMPLFELRRALSQLPKYVSQNRKRIRLVAQSIAYCVVTSSIGWLAYEVHETILNIEHCVQKDPMLLNHKAPEYIFVDKASFTELDEYQIIDSNSIIQPTNPPVFFLQKWNDFKHKKAWKLLEVANNCKNSKFAWAATQRLTTMVHLKDSDFQYLAQMSQAHTLVGLARSSNTNPKFFLPPRNISWTKDEILNKIRDLLIKLNELNEHKCLSYFVAYAFKKKQNDYCHPEDIPPDFRSMHIDNDNILQLCINALRHHCNNETNVTAMVKLGGLQILMAVYQYLKNDEEVAEEIGKLLSVASLNKDLIQDIFLTGWISILFEWKNHKNFRIQSWANRTLLNMDDEDPNNCNYMFGKQTVLLHPKNRCHQDAKIDVVLVHGLLGGVSFSWREKDLLINEPLGLFDMNNKIESHNSSNTVIQKRPVGEDMQDYLDSYKEVKAREWDMVGSDFEYVLNDIPLKENAKGNGSYSLNGNNSTVRKTALNKGYSQCWPSDWLPTDEEGLRVIGVDYSTTLSEWFPSCPLKEKNHRTLEGRTEKLMNQLLAIGIGDRPIIFLAHSMGGLLVKNMLVTARNSNDPNTRKLFEKTRSIFFFSTPHHGSPLATLNSAYRFFLWPSVEVDELRTDSPKLVSRLPPSPWSLVVCECRLIRDWRCAIARVFFPSCDFPISVVFSSVSHHVHRVVVGDRRKKGSLAHDETEERRLLKKKPRQKKNIILKMKLCFPLLVIMLSTVMATPCSFNSMCTCKTDEALRMHIACVAVPLYTVPDVAAGTRISHMDIMSSEIETVESDVLQNTHIESLRLMSNKIGIVSDRAFTSSGSVLRALDLSYNQLDKVPLKSFSSIKNLDWLNLHGNNIEVVGTHWNHLEDTLQHLFIGENDLIIFPEYFSKLRTLSTLNLDNNLITSIPPIIKTPPVLETLSISNNFLQEFPVSLTETGIALNRLYIRDNYIENMTNVIPNRFVKLEVLDLGMNRLESWSGQMFGGRSEVRNLHLDMNRLETLDSNAFDGLRSVRMYLSYNKLKNVDQKAFKGLERILEYLDLEHNNLEIIPTAIRTLKNLKFLYLSSNDLNQIDLADFTGVSSSLRSLSLSGNSLTEIPSNALINCTKLSHLNLGYNFIREIKDNDFGDWAMHLDTLLLMNNKLKELTGRPFKNMIALRELSLSFNNIHYVDSDVFLDLATSLESLEISFGVYYDNFPVKILRHLKSLMWLVLDNNDISSVPVNSLHSLDSLKYLNMESNKISVLAPGTFSSPNQTNLREVRLNQNYLMSLEPNTFSNLQQLQTITISRNKIIEIMSHAYQNLPRLLNIDLSFNKIEYIQPSAFDFLPNLKRLDLQGNQLKELRMTSFINSTNLKTPLSLNVSNNCIEKAPVDDPSTPVYIKILDLSHNSLQDVPYKLLYFLSSSLRSLYLDYNHITKIYNSEFEHLSNLELLSMTKNGLTSIASKSFRNLTSLQILYLSDNKIQQLSSEQFAMLPKLRVLSLARNQLSTLSWDILSGTPLEYIDLSDNELLGVPAGVLMKTGTTLRHLLLANNQIDHVDGTTFSDVPKLANLSLANNKLTIIPDNTFVGLSSLISLDLSSNSIRANFKELFHYVQNVRHLNLANTGLIETPPLPLPSLISLRLSNNKLEKVSRSSMEMLSQLKTLYLNDNKLTSSPSHIWSLLPSLKILDLSSNPIKTINKASFSGLSRLQHLRVQQLRYLDRFDAGSLSKLSTLQSLATDWQPNLGQIVCAAVQSIRSLSVHVNRVRLSKPIVDGCGPKLESVSITGPQLRYVDPMVFSGVERGVGERLTVRIRHTSIEDLPTDLLLPLAGVPKLALDLTGNKLTSLNPLTVYTNYTTWENSGTNILKGGLYLDDNPLQCDCGLLWLGQWLRRWLREAVQVHTLSMAETQLAQWTVRRATCADPRNGGARVPVADIYPEDLRCKASALSGSGTGNTAAKTSHLIVCLVRSLSVFYLVTVWCNVY